MMYATIIDMHLSHDFDFLTEGPVISSCNSGILFAALAPNHYRSSEIQVQAVCSRGVQVCVHTGPASQTACKIYN